jgi:hypothetical protein
MESSGSSDKFGYGEDVPVNEEVRMKNEEQAPENDGLASVDERLIAISKSIKAVGSMTGTGISYCIVIPGHGVMEDSRLSSCCIAPPADRSDRMIIQELAGNLSCMIQAFLSSLRQDGLSDGAAKGILNKTIEDAKNRYEDQWKPFENAGAGPM